jgi:HD-GYP domain-containing protein (c-di-GMP phosphodiesterase class II)
LGTVIEELSPKIIGKRLGQNLYNSNGNLLLRKGIEINARFYERFEELGYKSIYLLKSEDEKSSHLTGNVISAQLIASGPGWLKRIFRRLSQEEGGPYLNAKGELIELAKYILKNVDFQVASLPEVLDLKRHEDYLYQHSINVAVYSALIGRRLEYDKKKTYHLILSALLHDFGMMFVDPEIVNKAERLEPEEFEHVKEHTIKGFSHLVRRCSFDGLSTIASVQHHERVDGAGYPNNLEVGRIHEYSRIISVTDSFDAWTSDRPHRRMQSIESALNFLKDNQEKMFDPDVVAHFLKIF